MDSVSFHCLSSQCLQWALKDTHDPAVRLRDARLNKVNMSHLMTKLSAPAEVAVPSSARDQYYFVVLVLEG